MIQENPYARVENEALLTTTPVVDRTATPWAMIVLVALCLVLFGACSDSEGNGGQTDAGPSDGAGSGDSTAGGGAAVFPSGLALGSPLATIPPGNPGPNPGQQENGLSSTTAALTGGWSTAYEAASAQIEGVRSGTIDPAQVIDANRLFGTPRSARCFGPSILYQDHPDGPAGSGELPGGDVGLWSETEGDTSEACAAAQINMLMSAMSEQSTTALTLLAALAARAAASAAALPDPGSSVDLLEPMNGLGLAEVTFTNAKLDLTADQRWRYDLELDHGDASTRRVTIVLDHVPDASGDEDRYEGLLYWRITGDASSFPGGNCTENARTLNGSLRYERSSKSSMVLQSRTATFCGADVDGRITASEDPAVGQLDVAATFPGTPDGWSESFHLLVANFDPTTNAGVYSYLWQAGAQDGFSRAFHIGINDTEPQDGEAYYGYGSRIHQTDGTVLGMICNWAGPGSNQTVQAFAQRQFVRFDETSGVFAQPQGGSDILYAPTNSCAYDGNSSFVYDRDADRDLADESASDPLTPDLFAPSGEESVAEAIAARGFAVPAAPGGWPAE